MNDAARKMVPRAPRYVLGPGDNQIIRFAFQETKGPAAALRTSMVNLSETGLAFVIDSVIAPELGEKIKIEIPVPGADQIAWYGKVVRIEVYDDKQWWFQRNVTSERERVLVGIRFEDLPPGHQKVIRKGLEKSFLEALRAERERRMAFWKHYLIINGPQLLLWGLVFLAAVGIVYYMDVNNIRSPRIR